MFAAFALANGIGPSIAGWSFDRFSLLRAREPNLIRGIAKPAETSAACRRLMTVPEVAPLVVLTDAACLDGPGRFRDAAQLAHSGLTPRRFQR